MRRIMAVLTWPIVLISVATIGMAPFVPEPHVWEKLKMLMAGELSQTVDILDLLMHGTPWLLLLLKIIHTLFSSPKPD